MYKEMLRSISRENAHMGARYIQLPKHVLSDENFKTIQNCTDPKELAEAIIERGAPFNERDVFILLKAIGNPEGHNIDEGDEDWSDDILSKYADHIQNYEYTYKPEAQKIDPEIDPNEKHIGPMAQDIEKVNPACIKETANGTKTVDTGRLALMNAGAIADLAREVKGLKHE